MTNAYSLEIQFLLLNSKLCSIFIVIKLIFFLLLRLAEVCYWVFNL